jgi:diguanylate cyclase (GGDEF)-like protein
MMMSTSILVFKNAEKVIVEILTKETLSVGRSTTDDVFIDAQGVSRCHATIRLSDDVFWIIDGDLNGRISTNGLFVNGKRISIHKLSQYDVVTFCKGSYALFLTCPGGLEITTLFKNSVKKLISFVDSQNEQALFFTDDLVNSFDGIKHKTVSASQRDVRLDELTQLPNRNTFFARVNRSLEFKEKISKDYQFAILFIDIDRFKLINDSLGHAVGDQFLIKIAERLSDCLRETDMVARLGGDEFAILLDNLKDPKEAITTAKRLQEHLTKALQLEELEIYPSLSIGIALSRLEYQTVEEIIRDADTAMYHAKDGGRSRFVVFDQEMHQKAAKLLKLHGDLRRSAENQEFQLYFQPIVSLAEKELVGFEALIRWNHSEHGFISPDVFIPIAEETNLIYQIGQWVLEEACRQLSLWKQNPAIKGPLFMNVNLSSKQLSDHRLVEKIKATLSKYAIFPGELKLEVTESIVMENSEYSIAVFNQLKELGVQVAIDDFGTGYSSLSYLNRFPIDTLKVDRSFISKIDDSDANTSIKITHSIISLAHSLGVKVVAEGIERLYHLAYLTQLKCDYGQGYLFSKPLEAKDATCLAEKGLDWRWEL